MRAIRMFAAPTARGAFALFILAGVLVILTRLTPHSATAHPDAAAQSNKETLEPAKMRLLENRVPEHLPIKVRIKREKEKLFRDLNNDNWAGDLELEVKNTGDKPIYFLYFGLEVPEAKIENSYQTFGIVYGNVRLSKWGESPTPDDPPIKPGETVVLKIEGTQIRGWDQARRSDLAPKRIHGVRLVFQNLSFGDGTGFDGATGSPWPQSRSSRGDSSPPRGTSGILPIIRMKADQKIAEPLDAGMFQPASFFAADEAATQINYSLASDALDPECNCANSSCSYGTPYSVDTNATNQYCYQCGTIQRFAHAFCTQPGSCHFVDVRYRWCFSTNTPFSCPWEYVVDCATNPPSGCQGNPPNSDCKCAYDATSDTYDWDCQQNCGPGSTYADYNQYPETGCPPYATNVSGNGQPSNCCVCNQTDHNCGSDCHWDEVLCNCFDQIYQPCGGCFADYTPCPVDECCSGNCDINQRICLPADNDGCGDGWTEGSLCYGDSDCDCHLFCNMDFYPGTCELISSPVVIDVDGNGFAMTNAANGVFFDFEGNGRLRRLSWTAPGSDDAWLVLDRNGNATIDNGKELFGNLSPQANGTSRKDRNGFLALSLYDEPVLGGNSDGVIDSRDAVFSKLRLWQDTNHNGISESTELHTLSAIGIESISLNYKLSQRTDQYGNIFRYRAKVYGPNHTDLGRWAYDVLLGTSTQTADVNLVPRSVLPGPLAPLLASSKIFQ